MADKVILVTGCSSGMGMATAVGLAGRGHTVFATMRNLGKRAALDAAAAVAKVALEVRRLDVQETDSIAAVVGEIIGAAGRLDVLINVAGAGQFLATEHASEADLEWVLDVNFKGMVRTTRAVLPHMRKARSGQIINVTSVGGLIGIPFNDLYCGAKFAIEGFTESLATYMTPAFGINFTCVEPGGIASDFIGTAMAQALASMPDDEYRAMFEEMFRGADSPEGRAAFQTAAECAAVVVDLVANATPPLRIRTGAWAEAFTHFKTAADPDGTRQVQQLAQMFRRR